MRGLRSAYEIGDALSVALVPPATEEAAGRAHDCGRRPRRGGTPTLAVSGGEITTILGGWK
jgi:hypothetical protein